MRQALLIPLWLKRVANDALIEPLKDTALSLPQPAGKQLDARIRGCARGRQSVAGGQLHPPETGSSCGDSYRSLSAQDLSLRLGTFGFRNGLGGESLSTAVCEGLRLGQRDAGHVLSGCSGSAVTFAGAAPFLRHTLLEASRLVGRGWEPGSCRPDQSCVRHPEGAGSPGQALQRGQCGVLAGSPEM